jgi:NTE family protein
VAIFRSSLGTRPLTRRVVYRLAELREKPCVLSDPDEEKHEEGCQLFPLGKANGELSIQEIRERDEGLLLV